jgi:hypothetical protein
MESGRIASEPPQTGIAGDGFVGNRTGGFHPNGGALWSVLSSIWPGYFQSTLGHTPAALQRLLSRSRAE